MTLAEPFYFGREQLFGWFHGAAATGNTVAVICNPHGYEDLCTHRLMRSLANQLAAAGVSTLRFDYPGTGDSAGSETDPHRGEAWVAGINTAIDQAKTSSGASNVVLVGLRLGALLAAITAQTRKDVLALVALAPCISGKSYTREAKALALLGRKLEGYPAPRPEWAGDLETAGHVLTAQTLSELSRFDFLKLTAAPGKVLLLTPDDAAPDARLLAHLRTLKCDVDQTPLKGFRAMMRDAHFATEPKESFEQVVAWVAKLQTPNPHSTSIGVRSQSLSFDGGVEQTVRLPNGLFGIETLPTAGQDSPAVVFLNTGSNHHIGSNRTAVTLGRALARQGTASFRFDVAGIGDSEGRADDGLYSLGHREDVAAALTHLEHQGFQRFVLVGLCSGAYLAFHAALQLPSVTGLILLNAQRFTWNEGDSLEVATRKSFRSSRFYYQAALKPETWKRVLSGKVNVRGIGSTLARRATERATRKLEGLKERLLSNESAGPVARGFAALGERGTRVLLIYSAEDGGLDELELQLGAGGKQLKDQPGFRVEIIEGADHTLTARWARERFEQTLLSYVGV